VSRRAWAQAYPTRPVRIIVAAAAGGGTDIAARLISQSLTERLGQSFFVENRPGGNNNIGTEVVVRAPPDGYTLLLANSVNAVNASLYERLSYNFIRDLVPVARIAEAPNLMVVHPQFPARSVPEFVAYAKANPGGLNIGTASAGTGARVIGELFKIITGVNLAQVHYRGEAPALADLLGQHVDVVFASWPGSIAYVKADRLRALVSLIDSFGEQLSQVFMLRVFDVDTIC
jgi:tripartite-type tricarboxylate transporter receptor subunit TctC